MSLIHFIGFLNRKQLKIILRQLRKKGINFSDLNGWGYKYYWNNGLFRFVGKVVEVIYISSMHIASKCKQLVFQKWNRQILC